VTNDLVAIQVASNCEAIVLKGPRVGSLILTNAKTCFLIGDLHL